MAGKLDNGSQMLWAKLRPDGTRLAFQLQDFGFDNISLLVCTIEVDRES